MSIVDIVFIVFRLFILFVLFILFILFIVYIVFRCLCSYFSPGFSWRDIPAWCTGCSNTWAFGIPYISKKKFVKIISLLSFCENSDMMYLRPGSMLQDSTLLHLFRGDWRSKLCRLHLWLWKCNQFNKFMCRVYIWLQGKPACDVQPIFTIIENMDVFDIPNWFHHTVTRIGCFHKFHLQKEIP